MPPLPGRWFCPWRVEGALVSPLLVLAHRLASAGARKAMRSARAFRKVERRSVLYVCRCRGCDEDGGGGGGMRSWWCWRSWCCHACWASRPMPDVFDAEPVPARAVSAAAAVHVATTVEEGVAGELRPMSRRPPEVQLRRTWLGETLDGAAAALGEEVKKRGRPAKKSWRPVRNEKDRRAAWLPPRPPAASATVAAATACAEKTDWAMLLPVKERWPWRPVAAGSCQTQESIEARTEAQKRRPSCWVEAELEGILHFRDGGEDGRRTGERRVVGGVFFFRLFKLQRKTRCKQPKWGGDGRGKAGLVSSQSLACVGGSG